jgi:hypothetical protein
MELSKDKSRPMRLLVIYLQVGGLVRITTSSGKLRDGNRAHSAEGGKGDARINLHVILSAERSTAACREPLTIVPLILPGTKFCDRRPSTVV